MNKMRHISLVGPTGTNVAGYLSIAGDYTQSAGGELDVALRGVAAGSEYSKLEVGGSPFRDGTLEVFLANGFVPSPGDMFEVVTAGSVNGRFAEIVLPNAGEYGLVYASDGIFITALPEPSGMDILIAGAAGLMRRKRG